MSDNPIIEAQMPAPITFKMKEYIGGEVKTVPSGLAHEELNDASNWPEGFKPQVIKEKEELVNGTLVLVPTLFGPAVARVRKGDGHLYGVSPTESTMYFLQYGEDDRNCWVCTGSANLAAIRKLSLDSKRHDYLP